MSSNGTATALATIGTVCWCIQLIPQVIRNWYVRDCEGVPPPMFFLFATCGVPFGIYFIDQSANTALMVQPHLFMFFSFVGFWQSLYYPPVSWSFKKSWLTVLVIVAISAGIEVGCVIPLRKLYNEGTEWPNLIPGIVAAVMLALGLVPPYLELFKRNGEVVGINFLFLILDSSGAVFSIASVALEPGKLDILGLVLYAIVLGMEYGIMASHMVWKFRVKHCGLKVRPLEESMELEQLKKEGANPPITQNLRDKVTKLVLPIELWVQSFSHSKLKSETSSMESVDMTKTAGSGSVYLEKGDVQECVKRCNVSDP